LTLGSPAKCSTVVAVHASRALRLPNAARGRMLEFEGRGTRDGAKVDLIGWAHGVPTSLLELWRAMLEGAGPIANGPSEDRAGLGINFVAQDLLAARRRTTSRAPLAAQMVYRD
jgi:hypothetical protein